MKLELIQNTVGEVALPVSFIHNLRTVIACGRNLPRLPGKGRLAKLVTHLENVSYTVPLDSRALAMRLDQVLGKHSLIFWKDLRRANLTML